MHYAHARWLFDWSPPKLPENWICRHPFRPDGKRSEAGLLHNQAAGDAIASVAGRIAFHVVRFGVNDEGSSTIAVEPGQMFGKVSIEPLLVRVTRLRSISWTAVEGKGLHEKYHGPDTKGVDRAVIAHGERVFVDKQALRDQVANDRNGGIRLCPFFDPGAVAASIDGLPDTLAADDSTWALVYDFEGKPAWLWPHGQIPPSNLSSSADGGHRGVGVSFGFDLTGAAVTNAPAGEQPAQRSVPPTRYADVLGQNAAVEAARDLIELPLKHADLFLRIGAKPIGHGIILAGPPGTGKTLLARAVAGECGAHIEIVNGPALLSKWVGETEAAIRAVFERAQKFAPAVILFDEIDSIAPSRSAESARHQVSVVAQLLVLLDGIEARGQIFVLATTNRPEHVDVALRRPGRFAQPRHRSWYP